MAFEEKLVFCKDIYHEKVIHFVFVPSLSDSDGVLLTLLSPKTPDFKVHLFTTNCSKAKG